MKIKFTDDDEKKPEPTKSPMSCPSCKKTYKSKKPYEKHIAACNIKRIDTQLDASEKINVDVKHKPQPQPHFNDHSAHFERLEQKIENFMQKFNENLQKPQKKTSDNEVNPALLKQVENITSKFRELSDYISKSESKPESESKPKSETKPESESKPEQDFSKTLTKAKSQPRPKSKNGKWLNI